MNIRDAVCYMHICAFSIISHINNNSEINKIADAISIKKDYKIFVKDVLETLNQEKALTINTAFSFFERLKNLNKDLSRILNNEEIPEESKSWLSYIWNFFKNTINQLLGKTKYPTNDSSFYQPVKELNNKFDTYEYNIDLYLK